MSLVLSFDERKRLATLFVLLVKVHKRVDANKKRSKKSKKAQTKHQEKGPYIRGPLFFLPTPVLLGKNISHNTMIDTIILLLTHNHFTITKPELFRPHAGFILKGNGIPGLYAKQNPTKKELKEGIYKPRLTLYSSLAKHNAFEPCLKIELSLPKLIFCNNFQELRYKDFDSVAKKLADVLDQMGVQTNEEILAQAPVSGIHYAKNIPLTDGTTPYHYINKIKEAQLNRSLDVNETNYKNDGYSYKWHCNAYEVVFYDKIKDLEQASKSEKRALEKDNALQAPLFKKLKKRKKKFEVLRMEVRLNKRQKIKQLFAKLKIKSDLTFKKLFKPAIARKVLLYYLDELTRKRLALFDYQANSDYEMLSHLTLNNLHLSPKQIIQQFGLKKALESMNLGQLRNLFAHYSSRSWQRLLVDARQAVLSKNLEGLEKIRECVVKMKVVKLF
jgi:hypothetical protein